jgi:hypothetical protein
MIQIFVSVGLFARAQRFRRTKPRLRTCGTVGIPIRRAGSGLRDRARHFSWTQPVVTRNKAATSSGVKISDNVSGVAAKGRLLSL